VHQQQQQQQQEAMVRNNFIYGGCTEQRIAAGGGGQQQIIKMRGAVRHCANNAKRLCNMTPRGAAQSLILLFILPPTVTRAPLCSVHPPL
jgi:hypothetical protein